MRRTKKAVSPLIATVLLISFAVALGSVVLNWGRNLDISSEDVCSQVRLEIESKARSDICYTREGDSAYLTFMLRNTGDARVEGLGIWIVGDKGTKLLDFDQFVIQPDKTLDVSDKSVMYSVPTYGNLKHVQFIPKAKNDDAIDICPGNSLKVEDIGFC